MVSSLNSRLGKNHKLFNAAETASLVAAIIGSSMAALSQQAFYASLPIVSFAFFNQVNRRQLEKSVQQPNSISKESIIEIKKQLVSYGMNISNIHQSINTQGQQLLSLESTQEQTINLSNNVKQFQEKITQIEKDSQQHLTKAHFAAITWKINQLQRQAKARQLKFKSYEATFSNIQKSINSLEQKQSLVKSEKEELANLLNLTTQLQEKVHQLDSASQNYVTKSQINNINSSIRTVKNQVESRIQGIQRQINDILPRIPDELQFWLIGRNLVVTRTCQNAAQDSNFNLIAKILGEKYSKLAPLYLQIKRSLITQNEVQFNLAQINNQDIVHYTNFCDKLLQASLVDSYQYDKNNRLIKISPPREGNKINFLTGGWFEEFVYQKIEKFLRDRNLQFQVLRNPELRFSTGDKYELDLLLMVKNQPLWIECKTGDYKEDLLRYCQHREILSISKERSVVVALGINDLHAEQQTSELELTITNEQNFLNRIERLFLNS